MLRIILKLLKFVLSKMVNNNLSILLFKQMKKIFLLIALAAVGLVGCKDDAVTPDPGTNEEFLASKEVQNKNAVLEDFTGVRCGYCPDGHRIAGDILATYPNRVVVIGVNSGGYAAPATGWANFTTPWGDALIAQSAVAGYPAGTMNRHLFVGKGQKTNGLAMSRNHWTATAEAMMAEVSPVNIGSKATFDAATRELTVKVDLYYTDKQEVGNNINIGLLQSGMIAKQSGGTNDYYHKHVLRDFITGQWGDVVPAAKTVKDSKFSKTFKYTVPADYNGPIIPPGGGEVKIEDCQVFVFVAQGKTEILTGITVPISVK